MKVTLGGNRDRKCLRLLSLLWLHRICRIYRIRRICNGICLVYGLARGLGLHTYMFTMQLLLWLLLLLLLLLRLVSVL